MLTTERRYRFLAALLLGACGGPAMASADDSGMEPLGEKEMAGVTGEGIAIAFDDIRLQAEPTGFFEATGAEPADGVDFERGDARYYGISLSGDNPETSWSGSCGPGLNDMGCPIGDRIEYFAPFDNPFLLRAFDYEAVNFVGQNTEETVLELLAPTDSSPWRMASWSELRVGGDDDNIHQGQIMLTDSKLSVERPEISGVDRGNNKIRVLSHTDPGDPTIGFIWHNHYEGNFRYSVNQESLSPDTRGVPPVFTDREGFYAMNIEAYVPLGHMFYQSLIFENVTDDDDELDGNFRMVVTRIPLNQTVYEDFYSLAVDDSLFAGYETDGRPERYYETHGFFRVGTGDGPNVTGDTPEDRAEDTTDGIFFRKGTNASTFEASAWRPDINPDDDPGPPETYSMSDLDNVNIGNVNIEGLLVQHMSLTTCGAGEGQAC